VSTASASRSRMPAARLAAPPARRPAASCLAAALAPPQWARPGLRPPSPGPEPKPSVHAAPQQRQGGDRQPRLPGRHEGAAQTAAGAQRHVPARPQQVRRVGLRAARAALGSGWPLARAQALGGRGIARAEWRWLPAALEARASRSWEPVGQLPSCGAAAFQRCASAASPAAASRPQPAGTPPSAAAPGPLRHPAPPAGPCR
jgi:hypothetical protein